MPEEQRSPAGEDGGSARAYALAEAALAGLRARGLTVATCESLTAGMVSAALARVPGASTVLRGGLVTYATELKHSLAGVDAALLAARGAVDPEVAEQMARGAARVCGADVGLACTGVAGPTPQDGRPVGRVYLAAVRVREHGADAVHSERLDLSGSRAEVRALTTQACLELLGRVGG